MRFNAGTNAPGTCLFPACRQICRTKPQRLPLAGASQTLDVFNVSSWYLTQPDISDGIIHICTSVNLCRNQPGLICTLSQHSLTRWVCSLSLALNRIRLSHLSNWIRWGKHIWTGHYISIWVELWPGCLWNWASWPHLPWSCPSEYPRTKGPWLCVLGLQVTKPGIKVRHWCFPDIKASGCFEQRAGHLFSASAGVSLDIPRPFHNMQSAGISAPEASNCGREPGSHMLWFSTGG